jgi:hypothetical protein
VLLQEQIERKPEAAPGETAGAAMTGRATVGKYFGARFALVEVLGVDGFAGQRGKGAKCENEREAMPLRSLPQRKCRRHLHPAIILRRDRANSVMVNPGSLNARSERGYGERLSKRRQRTVLGC